MLCNIKIRAWSFKWGLQNTGYLGYWGCHFELNQRYVLGLLLRQWLLEKKEGRKREREKTAWCLFWIILCTLTYSPDFDLSCSFSFLTGCQKPIFFLLHPSPGLCSSCPFLITKPSFMSASSRAFPLKCLKVTLIRGIKWYLYFCCGKWNFINSQTQLFSVTPLPVCFKATSGGSSGFVLSPNSHSELARLFPGIVIISYISCLVKG